MFYSPEEELQLTNEISEFCKEITTLMDSGLSFQEALATFFVHQHDFDNAYLTFKIASESTPTSTYARECFSDLCAMREKIMKTSFFGKKYVITGELENMDRDTALALIRLVGGKTSDNPVNDMDILVIGYCEWSALNEGKPTRKIIKAQELIKKGRPVRIINDETFISELSRACKDFLNEESYTYFFGK